MEDPPVTSEPSDRFLAAVGALTLNWAIIETGLDFCCAIVFHEFDGRNIEPEIPRSLGRKIAFLKKGMAHPRLTSIRAYGLDLLQTIKDRKNERHQIVHGALTGNAKEDAVQMMRTRYTPQMHHSSLHTVTVDQVKESSDRALALADPTIMLGIGLYNILRPEKPINYSPGQVAG